MNLWSAHHQMLLSFYHITQTVALHPGLLLPSSMALIASAPVANQAPYISPRLFPCDSRSIVIIVVVFPCFAYVPKFPSSLCLAFSPGHFVSSVSPPAFWTLARLFGLSLCLSPLQITFATDRPTPASRTILVSRSIYTCLLLSTLPQHTCEFLAIATYSDLPDYILIVIFCDGLNQPLSSELRRKGPHSSLAAFIDYALLCVGLSFTVGVVDEERGIAASVDSQHWQNGTPERIHIMAATAEPVHKMAAAPVRAHVMAATAEPVHKMAAKTELRHVTAATPEPSKAKAVFPESGQVAAAFPESSQVAAVVSESSQAKAVVPVSSQVTAVVPKSSQVSESSQVSAAVPESSKVTAVVPEPSQVTIGLHEPSHESGR
ncbi:C-type lectin domain family 4 member M [Labeo rohita]|uniref:C-type lectin domain family 4 member M n=1 Tax=Labeo rohita TaxID=84645 RepID=A0ABQ8L193_LABRO|nr:C-type lectin domain family 4 member M [Labeo rohita]